MKMTIGMKGTLFGVLFYCASQFSFGGELDSWSNDTAKQTIFSYANMTTDPSSPNLIPKKNRIAVFNNDGTLWSEKPVPVQLQFTLNQIYQLASKHPEWKIDQPFKAILESDQKYLNSMTEQEATKVLNVTHAGMLQSEFLNTIQN